MSSLHNFTNIDIFITETSTVYPKKYAHGYCFAVLCCGYTLTDFPTSIRLTSLALWQSNDCPSASKATLMNMDKYVMGIHYERLHNHNKAKHNKTVCIFIGIYCKHNDRHTEILWGILYRHITDHLLCFVILTCSNIEGDERPRIRLNGEKNILKFKERMDN